MELLRGGNLEQSNDRYCGEYHLAPKLMMPVAHAVAMAHSLGIVYRGPEAEKHHVSFRRHSCGEPSNDGFRLRACG